MRTYLDCIPCFVRQALDAVRFVTDDEGVHAEVLRQVLRAASEMDMRMAPPAMGQQIHRLIRRLTGRDDPYRDVKNRFNRFAMGLYPEMKARVEAAADPLAAAVRVAIAGNVIDFGVRSDLTEAAVRETIDRAMGEPICGSVDDLRDAAAEARDILFLADNAGEIVFDRVLIETLPTEKVTVVVKGRPVINDATINDARAAGLIGRVVVIDNGSDAPGTLLETCSDALRKRFDDADLVIAKGQGNYETLSDSEREILFLLMAKCPVIARDLGCEQGALILQRLAQTRKDTA
jgi:uncharacterized protein with ATP-grasp and redox domains